MPIGAGFTLVLPDGTNFAINDYSDFKQLFNIYGSAPWFQSYIEQMRDQPLLNEYLTHYETETAAYNNARDNGNWNQYYADMGLAGYTPDENMQKFLDNAISQQNTTNAQNFEREMRDSSLTSAASQLNQLGLSTSNVISTGGATHNGVGAAMTNMHTAGGLAQNKKIAEMQIAQQKYNAKMSLAKTLIGAAGSMASSGIYGGALGAMKHSASVLGSSAAHSALNMLQTMKDTKPMLFDQLLKDAEMRKMYGDGPQLSGMFQM